MLLTPVFLSFPCGSAGKESARNAGDLGLIPGLRRSPGEGNDYPLQYSGLENSMDCIVHGVAKNWTRLSGFHFHFLRQDVKTWHVDSKSLCFIPICILEISGQEITSSPSFWKVSEMLKCGIHWLKVLNSHITLSIFHTSIISISAQAHNSN